MTRQLDELTFPDSTARLLALVLLGRINKRRNDIRQIEDPDSKLNAIADLMVDCSYLSALSIAIDHNDTNILRRIRK
jgi:hypothetical protein